MGAEIDGFSLCVACTGKEWRRWNIPLSCNAATISSSLGIGALSHNGRLSVPYHLYWS